VIRRTSRLDGLALVAWLLVVVGAALSLCGADEIGRTPAGESIEVARAMILCGLVISCAGGGACVVLARRPS